MRRHSAPALAARLAALAATAGSGIRWGRRIGVEIWWDEDGHKRWTKTYSGDTWGWKLFDDTGHITAESRAGEESAGCQGRGRLSK